MIPKDNEDFAWWIIEKLIDEGYLEIRIEHFGAYGREDRYTDNFIKSEIRRLLMENEGEETV